MININVDIVWTQIRGLTSQSEINLLKENLRFHPIGYFFSPKYQEKDIDNQRTWDGWVNLLIEQSQLYVIDKSTGSEIYSVKNTFNDNIYKMKRRIRTDLGISLTDQEEIDDIADSKLMTADNLTTAEGVKLSDKHVAYKDLKNSMFLILSGMVPKLLQILKDNNIKYYLTKNYSNDHIQIKDEKLNGIELRYYQNDMVDIVKKKKRVVLQCATGGGKSLIIFKTVADIKCKWLIIVNRVTLFKQLLNDLKNMLNLKEGEINYISGEEKYYDSNNRITVAIFQSLYVEQKVKGKQRKRIITKHEEVLKSADGILIDECHHISENVIGSILKKCTKASYRVGLSATPTREDGYDDMIEAHVGPIGYRKGISELIKEGYLSKPKIYMLRTPYYENNPLTYKAMYGKFIKNEEINKKIAEIAYKFARRNKSVLISFTRVEHLKKVYKEIKKINKMDLVIEKIIGLNSADDKILAVKELNNKNYNIVLSTLFGEGVDCPKLDVLINCRNSKSAIDAIQQTGRALRIGDGQKYVIDFYYYNIYDGQEDNLIKETKINDDFDFGEEDKVEYDENDRPDEINDVKDYFKLYSKKRLKLYKQESEFDIHVINNINEIDEIREEGEN
jgi:superfamily II DNA or RNA helicase